MPPTRSSPNCGYFRKAAKEALPRTDGPPDQLLAQEDFVVADDASALVPSISGSGPVSTGPDAPIMEVLATMRSMRRLKPDPVPRELLEKLIAAATWGPTASDGQLYGYVVVTDREQIAKLGVLWRGVQQKYLAAIERIDPKAAGTPANLAMRAAVEHQAEHFDE